MTSNQFGIEVTIKNIKIIIEFNFDILGNCNICDIIERLSVIGY